MKVSIELPDYLCDRLDRIADERHISRDQLAQELLSGVVDRETERVAAELRRITRARGWRAAGDVRRREPSVPAHTS